MLKPWTVPFIRNCRARGRKRRTTSIAGPLSRKRDLFPRPRYFNKTSVDRYESRRETSDRARALDILQATPMSVSAARVNPPCSRSTRAPSGTEQSRATVTFQTPSDPRLRWINSFMFVKTFIHGFRAPWSHPTGRFLPKLDSNPTDCQIRSEPASRWDRSRWLSRCFYRSSDEISEISVLANRSTRDKLGR